MPIKSRSQLRWMAANDPKMLRRWLKETGDVSKLPEKVKRKKK